MTSSGRCHGPGCTQTAVVEFWCSERCQARWHGRTDPPAVAAATAFAEACRRMHPALLAAGAAFDRLARRHP